MRVFPIGNREKSRLRNSVESLPLNESYPYDVEAKILRRLPVRGPMVDVGSHSGFYSAVLEDLVGESNLHIFEPLPRLSRHLSRRFPKANIYPVALSDRSGPGRMTVPWINGRRFETRASLVANREYGQTDEETVFVALRTLDDVAAEVGLRPIRFLKVDVEGHEMSVLRGAEKTLLSNKPLILIEIEDRHHEFPVSVVFSWLQSRGYAGFFIDPAPNLVLRSTDEFDVERDQDPIVHARRQFQRYLNNFLFVDVLTADVLVSRVGRILAEERAILGRT